MPEPSQRPSKGASLLPWLPVAASLVHTVSQVDMNYGAAYYFFDYRHGFVKRGLLGVLFAGVHHLSRGQARLVELAILLLATAITYLVFRTPLFRDVEMTPLTAMLLSGPSLLPHFFLMFIPTDPLLYTVLVVCVFLLQKPEVTQAWAMSLAVCIVALLLHEGFAVRFYPLVIAVLLELCRRKKLRWSMAAAHVAIMVIAFGLILHFGKSQASPVQFAREAQARAGFAVDPQLFLLMHQTTAQARRQSMEFIWNRGTLQVFALSFLLAAPYLAGVAYTLKRGMQAAGAPTLQLAATAVLFCSPLMLCPVTTDWFRWLSDCVICASLFILYLYGADISDGPVRKTLRQWSRTGAVTFLLGYSCAIGPFAGMWLSAANTINHGYFDRFDPATDYYNRYQDAK